MALDHFRTFCWPIESSAGPTLSQAHSSGILLLLPSKPQLPLQQPQSHRMNGAAWGMWIQKEECHFAECYPPQYPKDVHAHTSTPQVQACLNTGGRKVLLWFFFCQLKDLCMRLESNYLCIIHTIYPWHFIRQREATSRITYKQVWKYGRRGEPWTWLRCEWLQWYGNFFALFIYFNHRFELVVSSVESEFKLFWGIFSPV